MGKDLQVDGRAGLGNKGQNAVLAMRYDANDIAAGN
jgi:hypothetical protein